MKKIIFVFLLSLCTLQIFSQDLTFVLNKDLEIEDSNGDYSFSFKAGEKFIPSYDGNGFCSDSTSGKVIFYLSNKNGREFGISGKDLSLADNKGTVPENISDYFWLPDYYYAQLKQNNRVDLILENESFWKTYKVYSEVKTDTWLDFFGIENFYFGDFYFVCGYNCCTAYDDVDVLAYLENINSNTLKYNVQRMYSRIFDYKYEYSDPRPDYMSLYKRETPFDIYFVIDGDYMNMYIDEISDKNLFKTLIRTSPEACTQIENWIKGKSNDLSKVTSPKHGNTSMVSMNSTIATKSSATTPTTNVSVKKLMTTNCNLKLRAAEATSSNVLTVMSQGTKVKILELGKAETIDGIKSNWVKVEVQGGAKDRDSKAIAPRTTGWCYGGYLE